MFRREKESQLNAKSNTNNTNPNASANSNAKVDLVTEEEAGGAGEQPMSIDAIPDVTELSTLIVDFIEFYDLPSTKRVRVANYPSYLNILYDKFNKMPMSMIKLLSDDENRADNLEKIIELLETLSKVKNGSVNIEAARDEFVEKQNEAYFYPAFGGKENLIKDIKDKGGKIE